MFIYSRLLLEVLTFFHGIGANEQMDRLMVAITPGHGYPWAVPEASQVPMASLLNVLKLTVILLFDHSIITIV